MRGQFDPTARMTREERAFFQHLGARIATLRREQDLTQVELAGILGVSQQTVHSMEKGLRRVPVSTLPLLAKTLAVSVEELLGEAPAPAKRGPAPKLLAQLERVARLPKAKQRFVSEMLDTVLQQEAR
jgi:transcriptional regulator with XRE-family HTH domain